MGNNNELRKGSTPTLILAVLADGPRHGYAIAREIERRSADALKMGEGACTRRCARWSGRDLSSASGRLQEHGPARRTYTLTPTARQNSFSRLKLGATLRRPSDLVIGGKPDAQPA